VKVSKRLSLEKEGRSEGEGEKEGRKENEGRTGRKELCGVRVYMQACIHIDNTIIKFQRFEKK